MAHIVDDSRMVRLTIPAKPEYVTLSRLALTGLAGVLALSDDTLADLKLALTEACSNSVRHAYGDADGRVQISFQLSEDRLVVEVSDDGAGFDPGANTRNGEQADDLTEGGLGIAIIRSIADELEIVAQEHGRGSRLRFVKLL
jgi:serine/threonine-protein kinase RsbW